MRFLLEIIGSVRKVWPTEHPLFLKISATERKEEGWDEQDSIRLATLLKEMKTVDLIDCSSGGNATGVRIPVGPLYQAGFAESIRKSTGMLTGAVGLITTAKEAASVVDEGKADLVFVAREFLCDPYFPRRIASEMDLAVEWPLQYERAKKKH